MRYIYVSSNYDTIAYKVQFVNENDMKLTQVLANYEIKQSKTKARNLIQETVEAYEKHIVWVNYLKERRLLYSGAEICNKRFGYGILKERLDWLRKKDCVSAIGAYNFLKGASDGKRAILPPVSKANDPQAP